MSNFSDSLVYKLEKGICEAEGTKGKSLTSSYPGWIKSPHIVTLGILEILDLNSLTIFGWLGGGYSGVNFGRPKSEVFQNGGGIPE